MKLFSIILGLYLALSSMPAIADESAGVKVHFKEGATMKFDPTDIRGSWKEPDTMMVNGDAAKGNFDLLSVRQNFFDREMADLGMDVSVSKGAKQ